MAWWNSLTWGANDNKIVVYTAKSNFLSTYHLATEFKLRTKGKLKESGTPGLVRFLKRKWGRQDQRLKVAPAGCLKQGEWRDEVRK